MTIPLFFELMFSLVGFGLLAVITLLVAYVLVKLWESRQ